jgi:hypothetical protein
VIPVVQILKHPSITTLDELKALDAFNPSFFYIREMENEDLEYGASVFCE